MTRPGTVRLLAVLGLALAAWMPSAPAGAADPGSGERIARRFCAGCHAIARNQRSSQTDIPTFVEISRQHGFSAERVALMLLTPHPPMPEFPITRGDAQDLAAYINSLKN